MMRLWSDPTEGFMVVGGGPAVGSGQVGGAMAAAAGGEAGDAGCAACSAALRSYRRKKVNQRGRGLTGDEI